MKKWRRWAWANSHGSHWQRKALEHKIGNIFAHTLLWSSAMTRQPRTWRWIDAGKAAEDTRWQCHRETAQTFHVVCGNALLSSFVVESILASTIIQVWMHAAHPKPFSLSKNIEHASCRLTFNVTLASNRSPTIVRSFSRSFVLTELSHGYAQSNHVEFGQMHNTSLLTSRKISFVEFLFVHHSELSYYSEF